MATSKIVGYECKFDPFFDSYEYFCKQCKHLAREATTTKCCEKTFCKECIETIIHEKKVCPSCQKDIPGSKPTYQAEILALEVRCSKGHDDTGSRTSMWNMYQCILPHFHKKVEGCEWKGKIKDLDAHTGDCVYVDMECPNGCGQKVQKSNEETHLAKECPNRALKEIQKLELRFQKFRDEQQALQDRQGEQDTELVQRVDNIATKLQKQQQKFQDQQQQQQGVHERKSQDLEKLVQRVEKIEVDATKLQKQQQKFQDQQQQQQGVHERKSQDLEKLVQRVEKIEVDATKLQKQQQKFQDQQQQQQGVHERKSQDLEKLVQRVEKIEVDATKLQKQQQKFQDQQDGQNSFETEVLSEQQEEFQRPKELTDTQHQTSRAENKGTENRLHTHSSRFGLTKSEIIYTNYQKHKTNNTTIDSPSLELETDHRYFLKLHPNGTEGGADPHLSLEISPDRKCQPNCPASIKVTIKLLNQHGDGDQDNVTRVMKYESIKKSGFPERGMTATKFISLADLKWTQYLKDDCLKFKIVEQQCS